ncbi:MAG: GNAT family protein [Bacteroidota bacterium]
MSSWKGKRVRLRGIELADAQFFFQLNQETATQQAFARTHFPQSIASQKAFIESIHVGVSQSDDFTFVIENMEGEPVGFINSHTTDRINGTFRYGLAILQGERRKGYAREAIFLLLSYFFQELRYHKVNAVVYEFNQGSMDLHQKMGFVEEGILRETHFSQGKHWDVHIFGMTKAEFLIHQESNLD